jgi:hypothetical protein
MAFFMEVSVVADQDSSLLFGLASWACVARAKPKEITAEIARFTKNVDTTN